MALYASDVKIPGTLSGTLSGVGNNAYKQIGTNYDTARSRLKTEAGARGMSGTQVAGPGSYADERFTTGQNQDIGNLESALGGGMGDTAYKNTLGEREYNQDTQLANEIGSLNKPDLLQQILSGVGDVGETSAQIYGAWGKNRSASPYSGGPSQGPLSLMQGFGGSRYGF